MNKKELTQTTLKKFLHYNPETGVCTSKISSLKMTANTILGALDCNGYIKISVAGIAYKRATLAYLYIEGKFPEKGTEIDHINGIKSEDSYDNLRIVTVAANQWNSKLNSRNTTGIKGLSIRRNGYTACITANRQRYEKNFKANQKEEASSWLQSTRNLLHKEFANHG